MKHIKLVVAGFILLLALATLFGGQVSTVDAQWWFPYTISGSSTNTQLQFYIERVNTCPSSMGILIKDESGEEHHHSLSVYRLMNQCGAHFNLSIDYPGQNVSFKAFDPTRTDYRYTNWKPDNAGWFHWTPPALNPGQQRYEFIGDTVKTVRLEFPATGYYKVAAELTQGQADPAGMLCDLLPCEPDGISAQALGMSLSFHAEKGQKLYFSTWSHNGEPGTVLITFNERGRVILPLILKNADFFPPKPTDTPLPPPVVVTTTPAATDTPLPPPIAPTDTPLPSPTF